MKRILAKVLFACCLIGFSHGYSQDNSRLTENRPVELEVLSWSPRIFVFHHFLNEEECDHLINLAEPYLTRSTVVDEHSSEGRIDEVRTSRGMFFPPYFEDALIQDIENRISLITLIPRENGEDIQVLHYQAGGQYQPHYDYFDTSTTGGAYHYNRGGQRVASFLMYLNTPEEGGYTVFPIANIQVTPRKGDALLFFDCDLEGQVDPLTLHGGAPVIKGEKWLATKWLRQHPFK